MPQILGNREAWKANSAGTFHRSQEKRVLAITVALGTCLRGNLEICVYMCVCVVGFFFVPRSCEVLIPMAGILSTNSVLTSHGHPVWFLPVWQ